MFNGVPANGPRRQDSIEGNKAPGKAKSSKFFSAPRYLGAKAWSFPGALKWGLKRMVTAPYYALSGKVRPADTTGKGYHFSKAGDLSRKETAAMIRFAAAAAAGSLNLSTAKDDSSFASGGRNQTQRSVDENSFEYNIAQGFNFSPVEGDLKIVSGLPKMTAQQLETFEKKGMSEADEKNLKKVLYYSDKNTGLKFTVLEDTKRPGEIIVSFSAWTDSTDKISKNQKSAAKKQLAGAVPACFDQAAAVVKLIQEKHPEKKVTTTGVCFGGALAQYSALQNNVEAKCFNCLAIGAGLQAKIGREKLEMADDLVVHVKVKGDFLPISQSNLINKIVMYGTKFFDRSFSFFGIRTPGNFGKVFEIPPARESYTTIERHQKIDNSMLVYAEWREPA